MSVRVRIAPSPTGNLHIGTARAALFNWLFARKNGGEFILRIEDTDLERSDKKYEQNIVDGLKWLGLTWDGEIYRQSERLDIYKRYVKELFDSGKAFWCHHTKEELEAEKKGQMDRKEAPRHLCGHKNTDKGRQEGALLRLAINQGSDRKITFQDEIRGQVGWDERLLDDISLAKDFDTPLYNFAVVVDDIEMNITHVIRGEDHISNTPKQLLIYEALDKQPPVFAHLPLILGADRSKLSKRHGATSVIDYQKDYLPDALVNFMGFLGYTYSKEILTRNEMIRDFDLAKVHKSGAVFNIEKLNWLNSQYIKTLDLDAFKRLAGVPELPGQALPLVTERLEKLSDAGQFDYFWKMPEYDAELLHWKSETHEELIKSLKAVKNLLETFDFISKDQLRSELDSLGKELGGRGLAYWPFRAALTGRDKSPDPVDVAFALGSQETLKRIEAALGKLG